MTNVLALMRAERFSPNSVCKDDAILRAVCRQLAVRGAHINIIKEEELTAGINADIILTMGRLKTTNNMLKGYEAGGAVVINSPHGIEACSRAAIDRIMRLNDIPAAPQNGGGAVWIKRCDESAQCKDDIIFASNRETANRAVEKFRQRGITNLLITDHIEGDLIKFYGVSGTDFFKTFYPADDGISKFGDETLNGPARHYRFSVDALQHDAGRTAALAGVCIYGGDCIIRADGSYAVIDFNDWPSFSRCRDEAARAIADVAEKLHAEKRNIK